MEIKDCLPSFKTWLKNKSYSDSTIRNYLADINRYFTSIKNNNPFSSEIAQEYLRIISSHPNKNRYTSSLSKFFHFAIDQQIIKSNPLKRKYIKQQNSPNNILELYQNYLSQKKFSKATIKNYLNDIQQFIDWNQNNPES